MLLVHWGDCKCYQPCHSRSTLYLYWCSHCVLYCCWTNKLLDWLIDMRAESICVPVRVCEQLTVRHPTFTFPAIERIWRYHQCVRKTAMDPMTWWWYSAMPATYTDMLLLTDTSTFSVRSTASSFHNIPIVLKQNGKYSDNDNCQ